MGIINEGIANLLPFIPKPIVGFFSRRYIAGESLTDALNKISDLNDEGYLCTIDVLGENISTIDESQNALNHYKEALAAITEKKLDANLSIKMTQMGMGIDNDVCINNMIEIVSLAEQANNYVRIDMEDSPFTSKTLEIYNSLNAKYSNTGIVIQAYMKRSKADVEELIKTKSNVRLCKGIYREPEEIAIHDKELIRENFVMLLEMLLKGGCYVGIATHDDLLVKESYRVIEELGLNKDQYEFQMLLGVTEHMRKTILNDGHRLRVYVPFGEQWHAYSVRRLKENPEIAGHIIKNIFSFGK